MSSITCSGRAIMPTAAHTAALQKMVRVPQSMLLTPMATALLLKIRDLIRAYNAKEQQVPLREPDLMMVITGGPIAYTREDGVKVIPLGALKS